MAGWIIVSGGTVDRGQLRQYLDVHPDVSIVAADHGVDALLAIGRRPDHVIGDLDSASAEAVRAVSRWEREGISVRRLNPVKDDTDTEAALRLLLEEETGDITIFGATGTRIDHVLGNLVILGLGLSYGRKVTIMDLYNRVRLINEPFTLRKDEQFGAFVSLFPFEGAVRGLTLTGFAYPLKDAVLSGYSSLGVSNEIVEETASISFTEGVLILVESKD